MPKIDTGTGRIQVDARDLPEGVKPKLYALAKAQGLTMGSYIRAILIREAFSGPADYTAQDRITKSWEPVR